MGSVRARITALAVAFFLMVLTGAAGLVVLLQWRSMLVTADRSLAVTAAELELKLEERAGDYAGVLAGAADPLNPDDHFALIQAEVVGVSAAGSVVAATPNLAELTGRAGPIGPSTAGESTRFVTRDDVPIDDDRYRILARALDQSTGVAPGVLPILVVGESIDDQVDGVRSLASTLAVVVPLVTVAFGAAVWFLLGRMLLPVERIRRQVEAIGPRQLDQRVPVPDTDDEIARLARTMNSMLDRVDRASRRQERFVGDASHELRIPLTRMRTSLEVDLAGDDVRRAAVTALRETVAMQALVDDLLLLARLDHETPTDRSTLVQPVDLDVIVDAEVQRLRQDIAADTGDGPGEPASAETGSVTIDMSAVSAAGVIGRRGQLARVVRNLLVNAHGHARARVAVSLSDDGQRVTLRVDDDGPGVPAGQREAIFDRFTRLDDARGTAAGGTGLGLAIVADVIRSHGGTVGCSESPTGGARFEIILPSAGSSGPGGGW